MAVVFTPGVELTWPFRHEQMYKQNSLSEVAVTKSAPFFGLREIRVNAASYERQEEIFYNDFGNEMTAVDVKTFIDPTHEAHWLWELTPSDMTKWMGIPWQSDAGSCLKVFTNSQYPIPARWAANLPVDVLTEESMVKMRNIKITDDTRQDIYANRVPWLMTTDIGFVGYHAEGGYLNGLINMVYKWKDIGVVTGRLSNTPGDEIPETVYESLTNDNV